MDQKIKKAPKVIFIITLCLYLPFIESWFFATLWGLNWESPVVMAKLGDKLRLLKLFLVILGVVLLITQYKSIRDTINNTIVKNAFLVSGYLVAAVQIPLLCVSLYFDGISPSKLDYLHKEKTFNDRSIYVYTANPGPAGTAYHYFYLKCRLPLNRYELKLIKKMGWMREYGYEVQGNNLIVADKSEEGKFHIFDITNFSCNAKT